MLLVILPCATVDLLVTAVLTEPLPSNDVPQAVTVGAAAAAERRLDSPAGAADMELADDWNLLKMFRGEEDKAAPIDRATLAAPVGTREYLFRGMVPSQRFEFQAPMHPHQMDNWEALQEQLHEILASKGRWPPLVDCELDWWIDCLHYLANQVVFECFRDHELEYTEENFVPLGTIRNFLQWWLQGSVCVLVQEMIARSRKGEVVNAQFLGGLNDHVLGIGLRTIHQLCEGGNVPPHSSERASERNLAIQYLFNLARVSSVQSRQILIHGAIQDLSSIADSQYLDIFKQKNKRLNIFLQAAVTAIIYIRGDSYITGLQFANVDAFHNAVTVPGFEQAHAKFGCLPGFDTCDYAENIYLWRNYNMMVIMNQIVPAEKNKERFLVIASRLVEKRQHQTDGGNCGGSLRREVLYEIVSSKSPASQFLLR
jgi:hypothetical protein